MERLYMIGKDIWGWDSSGNFGWRCLGGSKFGVYKRGEDWNYEFSYYYYIGGSCNFEV